jgi:predicted esterase
MPKTSKFCRNPLREDSQQPGRQPRQPGAADQHCHSSIVPAQGSCARQPLRYRLEVRDHLQGAGIRRYVGMAALRASASGCSDAGRRCRGSDHCCIGAAVLLLCFEAMQHPAASAPAGFVPSVQRFPWAPTAEPRCRHTLNRAVSIVKTKATKEHTVWRHPMCKNSTAGMLASNCGFTYVGEPRPSKNDHSATVIWLHGLGDDGAKWSTVTQEMKMQWTKFVFPSAPLRRTRLRVRPTAAWFNAKSLNAEEEEEDVQGILEAAAHINTIVEEEIQQGIPQERIALVGFSMGGAVVLTAALQSSRSLGAVATINSWLPRCAIPAHMRKKSCLQDLASTTSRAPPAPLPTLTAVRAKTPIYMSHGDEDEVVDIEWGRASARQLAIVGHDPRFCSTRGVGHTPTPQQILDVADVLRDALPQISHPQYDCYDAGPRKR